MTTIESQNMTGYHPFQILSSLILDNFEPYGI